MQAINVDGAGDGGQDWQVFSSDGKRICLAVQDTIQVTSWEEKALEDAKAAYAAHHVNRYFFCTNRAHRQTSVSRLQDTISRETGMSATVLEARQIAELLLENSLQGRFLELLGEGTVTRAPQAPEIAFWAYSNLSSDRSDHRNQIFEDSILCILRERGTVLRQELVDRTVEFLGCPAAHRPLLDRRVDALLTGRKITKLQDGSGFMLTDETARKLQETERLYMSDWSELTGAMTAVLGDYRALWNADQAERGALFLARWFVSEQMNCLRSAKAHLLPGLWMHGSSDPQQQLRDLLQECGIQTRKLTEAIGKLVELARGRPAIAKLTRTAVFAALEGQDPLRSSQALGAPSWSSVHVLLDASVAIPLLCARRTESVHNYLFALSSRAVDVVSELGAKIRLSPGHLEECAAHLLGAVNYQPIQQDEDFSLALKHSDNAFVSYFYALRHEGRRAPKSLEQFLGVFSRNAVGLARNTGRSSSAVRAVMPDLQSAFSEYGVLVDQMERVSRLRFEAISRAHDLVLAEEHREKPIVLRKHDLSALTHIDGRVTAYRESWMFLTWDRVVIRAGAKELSNSWVVSPEVAIDFAQSCRRLSESQWCSLAHKIARISDPRETLTARILDMVVRFRHELLHDWEFKDMVRQFRDEAVQRAPVGDETRLQAWIEREATEFIKGRGIDTRGVEAEVQEEIEYSDDENSGSSPSA